MSACGLGFSPLAGPYPGLTRFIFCVPLGEFLTETSGRFNLGQKVLVFGAMSGYAVLTKTNSAFMRVGAGARGLFWVVAWVGLQVQRENDIACLGSP